ncbi:MAG: hypothetical protein HY291_02935 [Planctomycetes bacterium]|nr:hypothetical protein [Planctomycetota bacterium]
MRSSSKTVNVIGAACALALAATAALAGEGEKSAEMPGAKQEAILGAEDLKRIQNLFDAMKQAFLARDAAAATRLFIPRSPEEQARLDQIAVNIRKELRKERYEAGSGFEVEELEPDAKLSPVRYSVWVRIHYKLLDKPNMPARTSTHNDFFVLERMPDGSFAFVDSPYFDTLGQRQGLNIVADAMLALLGLLAALSFWVWMGFEAFRMRPRSHGWRVFVFVPLLGALVFFLAAYLPRLRGGMLGKEA